MTKWHQVAWLKVATSHRSWILGWRALCRDGARHHTGEAVMTHTTDQERAEFEAWYIAGARKAVPAFAEWSEIEIREGCMRPDSGSYRRDSARIAWDAWQAARRAPAAPETIEQRAKKLKGLQVLIGATAGVPEAIELARSRFTEAYGRSPLHDDLAYACLLIDAYGGAPSVPVPQGVLEAAQRAHDWMESQADSQSKGNHHSFDLFCLRHERDALAEALAAAPQPPEAALVQMQEPVAVAFRFETEENGPTETSFYPSDRIGMGWTALYTEQQVRTILAQHGIKTK